MLYVPTVSYSNILKFPASVTTYKTHTDYCAHGIDDWIH